MLCNGFGCLPRPLSLSLLIPIVAHSVNPTRHFGSAVVEVDHGNQEGLLPGHVDLRWLLRLDVLGTMRGTTRSVLVPTESGGDGVTVTLWWVSCGWLSCLSSPCWYWQSSPISIVRRWHALQLSWLCSWAALSLLIPIDGRSICTTRSFGRITGREKDTFQNIWVFKIRPSAGRVHAQCEPDFESRGYIKFAIAFEPAFTTRLAFYAR